MPNYWWVNQGQSYAPELHAGILWAPKLTENGRRQRHWETMIEVAIGDRILHYADQVVKAVSVVRTPRALWKLLLDRSGAPGPVLGPVGSEL